MKAKACVTKAFIKRLSKEQLKELIILCGKKENLDVFKSLQSLDEIELKFLDLEEDDELDEDLYIRAYIGKELQLYQTYALNDFEMTECTGYATTNYDELLRKYLACQFGEEYIEYVYNKRIKDADYEKQRLTLYYHEFKNEKENSSKVLKKTLDS